MAQLITVQPRQSGGKEKKDDPLGIGLSTRDLLTAAGIAAGGYFALPAGGAALKAGEIIGAAGGGGALGGMVGGLIDRQKGQSQGQSSSPQASQIGSGTEKSKAISRRLEQIAADNGSRQNLDTLLAAEQASAKLPEQDRQAYQPVLTQARMLEEQRLKQYYG